MSDEQKREEKHGFIKGKTERHTLHWRKKEEPKRCDCQEKYDIVHDLFVYGCPRCSKAVEEQFDEIYGSDK